MISFKQLRAFHKWPGILFLFPAFLISITSILLAFDGVLQLNKINTNIPTLAQSSGKAEVKAMVSTPSKQFIGTKNGLFIADLYGIVEVDELKGFDIRSLLMLNDTLFVAAKQGLWMVADNNISQLYAGEVTHVSGVSSGSLLLSRGKDGIVLLEKKESWKVANLPINLSEAMSHFNSARTLPQTQTLHKLVMDLHTGEAIVGKTLKPWWIAMCGFQLLILTITGLWFLFKRKKKK